MNVKILAFSGSLRKDSYNKKMIKIAQRGAEQGGAEVQWIDLNDFLFPIFNEDFEKMNGVPSLVLEFKKLLIQQDGFLIASPEYNSGFSAALKNVIDWASRPVQGESPMACFKGKFAALMSASPGALGGLRGLVHLRSVLENIGTMVIPNQIAISKAHEAFDEAGELKDEKQKKLVLGLGEELAQFVTKIKKGSS